MPVQVGGNHRGTMAARPRLPPSVSYFKLLLFSSLYSNFTQTILQSAINLRDQSCFALLHIIHILSASAANHVFVRV
jgi:hypothetical protein